MKLEIGKEYVTRSGLKAKVYDIAGAGEYPVIAGVLKDNIVTPTSYTIDGVYVCGRSSSYDIIGEWQEPLDFDWSCLPAWASECIAMDSEGVWIAFNCKSLKSSEYLNYKEISIRIHEDYTPKNFKGTWKDSLFKNPNLPCYSPQTKE
jgi:hypothetical protein